MEPLRNPPDTLKWVPLIEVNGFHFGPPDIRAIEAGILLRALREKR